MFLLADDPHDLGIPPNRGPLPVRRNPNSKPNPRVRSGHRRNAQPQGFGGSELTETLYDYCIAYILEEVLSGVPVWLHYVPGTVFRTNSAPLKDEADEVRIEAIISMLVNVLWSGLDVLFRGLEILLLWVLQLGIELLGFDLTVLDLCGLILV
ncbi:hypothetical protein CK203_065738 [Vitis vinifera]|uniref:Uncharacterized protein n=1 Tax=Vitis vinifera TaxID=29760 RepID=A0A438G3T1_VITVI|nr:hypothetical protein CK203_065738 [Vitis vinifera]